MHLFIEFFSNLFRKSFIFVLLVVVLPACDQQVSKQHEEPAKAALIAPDEKDYELANEQLVKLSKQGIDSIIFYQRTCINCCDFYNIFWTLHGEVFLIKFFFDTSDMKTHSVIVNLQGSRIFKELNRLYDGLKHTAIKGNSHRQPDGTSTICVIDHYCYNRLKIYTCRDSIISEMKDHDFDPFTAYYFEKGVKKEKNDHYLENKKSGWNTLLLLIEKELAAMAGTSRREAEMLRTATSGKQDSVKLKANEPK